MSLVSNIYAEFHGTTTFAESAKLQNLRDQVELFNEFDCASSKAALGRYSAKDTINVLKNFIKTVTHQLK